MKAKYDTPFLDVIFIQFSLILLFSLIYYSLLDDFTSSVKIHALDYLDCLSLSTTIQAGIGLTNMQPQTDISILLTTLHQIVMILSSIYIVFAFTMGS
jgi:hypothetical protein